VLDTPANVYVQVLRQIWVVSRGIEQGIEI